MLQPQKELETMQDEKTRNNLQEIASELRPIVLSAIVGLLLGTLGGVIFFSMMPSEWEAQALVRIGLTARDQNKIETIESQASTVERIRTESFKYEVSSSLKADSTQAASGGSLPRRTMKAAVVPGTDLIRISARGLTPEAAKIAVDTAARKLREVHAQMAAPFLEDVEQRLAFVESRITDKNKDLQRIQVEIFEVLRKPKAETAQVLLLQSMMDDASKQLNVFHAERLDLLRTIRLLRTASTTPIVPTFTKTEPVSPSLSKVLIMSAVLGGMFGCVVAWSKMRTKSGLRS